MICSRCGKQIPDNAGRCSACGTGVATGVLTPPPGKSSTARTRPLPTDISMDAPTIVGGGGEPATMFASAADTPSSSDLKEQTAFIPTEPQTTFAGGDQPTMVPGFEASTQVFGGDGATDAGFGGSESADHGPLSVGQVFGTRYHIIRLLGIGGMGAVYQAWDEELAVAVAIKVIRPEVMADPTAAADIERRFKRELLLARQVTHKNVVRIHDLGEIDGIKYITMAYVNGADLSSLIRKQGPIPPTKMLRVARSIVSGLVAAHTAGVVHRDLKPANIMVDATDEALIMDFGIARSTAEPVARTAAGPKRPPAGARRPTPKYTDATAVGAIIGTVEYMAPEQARGQEVDQRADIYALGLILYDMLAGRRRAELAGSAFGELQARMEQAPPAIKTVVPDIPDALDRIVSRCIEPDREKRFQTTAELAAELDRLDDNGEPIPIKRVVGMKVLTAIVVLAVTLLGSSWWYASRLIPAAQHEAVSVLIANFENRTHDATFADSLEQALGDSIEGASFITNFRRDEAQRLVAKLNAGSKLDEPAAQLVSRREGIKAVLAGVIESKGTGYTVSVRVVDPGNAKTLASASASAASKGEVLKAIVSVGVRIRRILGDTSPESEKLAAAETVTAGSLEALADYSHAQDLLFNLKDEEAITYYKRAIERDPKFGRAYANWATAAGNLGRRDEAAAQWKKALALTDRMTDREKYRTFGGYNLAITQNYDTAIESYSTLVKLYPYDRVGHLNLALAYFYVRNFPKALEEGRRAIEVDPKSLINGSNYALYAMYAGDFKTAAVEARKVIDQDPTSFRAYMPFAVAAIAESDTTAAADAYARMAKSDAQGAAIANIGLADLAIYQGRYADAAALLNERLADDQRAKETAYVATKYLMLAEAYEADGKAGPAVDAVRAALKIGRREEAVLVPAARLFSRLAREPEARALATELGQRLEAHSRAYGSTIEGELAARHQRTVDAVNALRAAQKLTDVWLARFDLGIAYVEAGHHAEGLSELEECAKRRGEASAIFLDDVPSFRYLATLPYWLARAQEGVGSVPAAVENYKAYLQIRSAAARDPLGADARRRLKNLPAA